MIRPRLQLVALVACAALAAAGCGSDDEEPGPGIPRAAADQLSRELDLLQDRIDVTREQSKPGSCGDIESKSYPEIQQIIDGLPDDTDPDVRRALERSIDRLKELAESECSELVEEIEKRREEAPPPVTTPPPAPVQPDTTPEPTETEEEPKEKEKEKKPKDDEEQDDGNGGLGPDGQGPPGQEGGGQPGPPAQDG